MKIFFDSLSEIDFEKRQNYTIGVFPEYDDRSLSSLLWELQSTILKDSNAKNEIDKALNHALEIKQMVKGMNKIFQKYPDNSSNLSSPVTRQRTSEHIKSELYDEFLDEYITMKIDKDPITVKDIHYNYKKYINNIIKLSKIEYTNMDKLLNLISGGLYRMELEQTKIVLESTPSEKIDPKSYTGRPEKIKGATDSQVKERSTPPEKEGFTGHPDAIIGATSGYNIHNRSFLTIIENYLIPFDLERWDKPFSTIWSRNNRSLLPPFKH